MPKSKAAAVATGEAEEAAQASALLAQALGRSPSARAEPARSSARSPGAGMDGEGAFPLTNRAGGHDLTEDNWEQRSRDMAALARKNEEANLNAKLHYGILSKREQAALGPSLLAEVEAAAVARESSAETAEAIREAQLNPKEAAAAGQLVSEFTTLSQRQWQQLR